MATRLFIATVNHRHGFGAVGGGPTEADAFAAVVTWCDQFWDDEVVDDEGEIVPRPKDQEEFVRHYMERTEEGYDISEIEVEL